MTFAEGFRAGAGAVSGMKQQQREDEIFKQQQEDRQRQEDARNSYEQLQKDYYTGQGEFAPKVNMNDPNMATADASYDRLENQRLGIQPTTPGVTPANQPGLSMSNQQLASTQPQTLSPEAKDQVYYAKLGQWAQTHLPPEKAMAYLNDLNKFKETNYQQVQTDAARAAASGDRAGLEHLADLHNGLIPDGYHIDSSKAQFDPASGDWHGVFVSNDKGDVKPLTVDHNVLSRFWAGTSLPNVLALRHQVFTEDQASKKDVREQKALDIQSQELGLRGKVADSAIAKNQAEVRQGDARIGLEGARVRTEGARLGLASKQTELEGRRIDLAGQELELKKQALQGDEKAKDLLSRQNAFSNEFSYTPPKRDALMQTPELEAQDAARVQAGKQLTSIATEIYSRSAEGAKPGERNGIQSETRAFMRQFGNGTLDPRKLRDNGDGTVTYGRLTVPADLMGGYKSKTSPGLKAPGASGAY